MRNLRNFEKFAVTDSLTKTTLLNLSEQQMSSLLILQLSVPVRIKIVCSSLVNGQWINEYHRIQASNHYGIYALNVIDTPESPHIEVKQHIELNISSTSLNGA